MKRRRRHSEAARRAKTWSSRRRRTLSNPRRANRRVRVAVHVARGCVLRVTAEHGVGLCTKTITFQNRTSISRMDGIWHCLTRRRKVDVGDDGDMSHRFVHTRLKVCFHIPRIGFLCHQNITHSIPYFDTICHSFGRVFRAAAAWRACPGEGRPVWVHFFWRRREGRGRHHPSARTHLSLPRTPHTHHHHHHSPCPCTRRRSR